MCAACGTTNEPDAVLCAGCGASLGAPDYGQTPGETDGAKSRSRRGGKAVYIPVIVGVLLVAFAFSGFGTRLATNMWHGAGGGFSAISAWIDNAIHPKPYTPPPPTPITTTGVLGDKNSLSRKRNYTFYGYLSQYTTAVVQIERYNAKKKAWQPITSSESSVSQTASDRGYRFTCKVRLDTPGKYRMRVVTGAPEGFTAGRSAYRTVTSS
jgi:hypothetical protein